MKHKVFPYAFSFLMLIVQHIPSAYGGNITINPVVSIQSGYTDNLFLDKNDKEEEFLNVVSLELTGTFKEKLRGVEISYTPEYSIYGRYDENNTLRHDASLYAWNDFDNHTRLGFTNRFFLTEDPLSDGELRREDEIVIPGDQTSRRSREKYYSNTSILEFSRRFGKRKSIRAAVLYSFLENDDPSVNDNQRLEPSMAFTYWFNQKYGTEAKAAYTDASFDSEADSEQGASNDFQNWFGSVRLFRSVSKSLSLFAQYDHIHRKYDKESNGNSESDYDVFHPMAGISYRIDKSIDTNLALGYFYQDNDSDEDEEGFTIDASIRKDWLLKRGKIGLLGDSGLDQNDFGAENIGLEYYVSLSCDASYFFYKNLSGSISGRIWHSDPIGNDTANGIDEQTRYNFSTGLNYTPYRWLAMLFKYEFTHYDADSINDNNGDDDDYSENRVWLGISLSSELPWRL